MLRTAKTTSCRKRYTLHIFFVGSRRGTFACIHFSRDPQQCLLAYTHPMCKRVTMVAGWLLFLPPPSSSPLSLFWFFFPRLLAFCISRMCAHSHICGIWRGRTQRVGLRSASVSVCACLCILLLHSYFSSYPKTCVYGALRAGSVSVLGAHVRQL